MEEEVIISAELAIKREILLQAILNDDYDWVKLRTEDDIDDAWNDFDDNYGYADAFRCSGIETGLSAPDSRHYECESVATRLADGKWVEWDYWHGGGKHGEPESIDWLSDARYIGCSEEIKSITVQTFYRFPDNKTND
jgi:hypothetical protein